MSLTVDIVEDDDAVRDSLRALLESYGYIVRDFASAPEFLKRGQSNPSDCMIVDQHMPGMTGLELMEMLRSQGTQTPALMVTGRNDPLLESRLARAGIFRLLHKPINDEQLVSCIEEARGHAAH